MRGCRESVAAALVWLAASPGAAQGWEPADGCTAFLTVQAQGCFVTNFWTCEEAPPGVIFDASYGAEGREGAFVTGPGGEWLASVWANNWREVMLNPAVDPPSIADLLAKGIDSYDFAVLGSGDDPADGVLRTVVRGTDILLGETVVIDGEELERTVFLTAYLDHSGKAVGFGHGAQYYSRKYGMFLLGTEQWVEGEDSGSSDNTPVDFILPGEPGFGAIVPVHGCDDETADGDPSAEDKAKAADAKADDGADVD